MASNDQMTAAFVRNYLLSHGIDEASPVFASSIFDGAQRTLHMERRVTIMSRLPIA